MLSLPFSFGEGGRRPDEVPSHVLIALAQAVLAPPANFKSHACQTQTPRPHQPVQPPSQTM